MLYFIKKGLPTSDGSKEVNVVIGAILNDGANVSKVISAEEAINSYPVFNTLRSSFLVNLAVPTGYDKPVITVAAENASATDVTRIYELLEKWSNQLGGKEIPTSALAQIMQVLMKNNMSKQDAAYVVSLCVGYLHYDDVVFSGELVPPANVYDPQFYRTTQEFFAELVKLNTSPFTVISDADNVTRKQISCDDLLFVRLPLRDSLLDDSVSVLSFLPKNDEVCEPYGSYELSDMSKYRDGTSGFPSSMYPLVEGNSASNGHALYDNEKLFHDALIEWIQFNMKKDAVSEIDVSPENPNLDTLSQSFLEELACFFYTRHWYHNINIPIYKEEDAEEYEMDNNVTSNYEFRTTEEEQKIFSTGVTSIDSARLKSARINALNVLKKYLNEASLTIGYKAYVDAIIQLARWGERKPTEIVLEGYSLAFHLATNDIRPFIGSIANYTCTEIDGCSSRAVEAFYYKNDFDDYAWLQSFGGTARHITIPVGLTTESILQNHVDSGTPDLKVYDYYSILDLVSAYLNGKEIKIAGIQFKNGKFTESLEIGMSDIVTLTTVEREIAAEETPKLKNYKEISSTLTDLAIEFDVSAHITHFNVLQGISRTDPIKSSLAKNEFHSKEEFYEKRANSVIRNAATAIRCNVASVILPVIAKASKKFDSINDPTFADVLNCYADAIHETGYCADDDFLHEVKNVTTENSMAVDEASMNKMNMFGETKSEEKTAESPMSGDAAITKSETKKGVLYREAPEDGDIYLLVDNASEVVGGYLNQFAGTNSAGRPVFKHYMLVPNDIAPSDPRIKGKKNVLAAYVLAMKNLYYLNEERENAVDVFYKDEVSMKYYVNLLRYKLVVRFNRPHHFYYWGN